MTSEAALFSALVLRALVDARRYDQVLEHAPAVLDALGAREMEPEVDATFRSTVLGFAAVSAYGLGRFPESLAYAERSVAEGRRVAGPNLSLARALGNRALAKEALGDLVGAQEDYTAALAMAGGLDDGAASEAIQTLRTNYADFLHNRGQHPEAQALLSLLSTAHGDLTALNNTAWARSILGEPEPEAIARFEDALRRAKAAGKLQLAGVAASNIGMLYFDLGEPDRALAYLTESADLLSREAESESLAITEYNLGVVLQRAGRLDDSVAHLKRALKLYLQLTPRSLKILWVLRHIALTRLVQRDFRRARAALRRGIALYEQVRPNVGHREDEHSGGFDSYRTLIELHLYLSMHERWIDEAFELVERGRARYWAETLTPLVPVPEPGRFHPQGIVGATAPDVLLLSFFVGPNATFLIHGRGGHLSSRRIDIGADGLRALVQDMTFDLLATPSRRGAREDNAKALAAMLLRDIDPSGARAVLVLPDGPLWALPFDALPLPGGGYLGDAAPVVAAPGIHVLRAMRGQQSDAEPGPVVVARPELGAHLPDLPGAERQAAVIAGLFPATRPPLLGPAATWPALRAALPTATHVHVAAHATAHAGQEPAVLLCDGAGAPVYVRVADIATVPLTAELVFLAACSTSLGPTSSGEGLISIGRAFLFAGARCVVGTLWPVPADETELMVAEFYRRLACGATLLDALHQTKQVARSRGLSPRTWAAFQGVGNFLTEVDAVAAFVERYWEAE
ncbi:CHAT domain-containing protein [Streptomyces ochraceiscleroticus]|uniref:CHAT domain-containing protein n=1 Tax=Streptomyces ochraceiscleroticus TaxID=47761 RepID=A0ABW1MLD9_9ACTN|nr:CHAT domain-containing tetratricopeptide repeat protein [Streptomyces ochraceiscleroticus]